MGPGAEANQPAGRDLAVPVADGDPDAHQLLQQLPRVAVESAVAH